MPDVDKEGMLLVEDIAADNPVPRGTVANKVLHGVVDPTLQTEGRLKINDFSIISKLGEGGFGSVVLACKKTSSKLYAIKLLPKKRMHGSKDAERVLAEVEAMQQLEHPFITRLHGTFQDNQRVYLILEFVGGGDLSRHLEKHGVFPEDWAQLYVAEIASALQHGVPLPLAQTAIAVNLPLRMPLTRKGLWHSP